MTEEIILQDKDEEQNLQKISSNFQFFAPATLLFAAFYTFCFYKNIKGSIMSPIAIVGTLYYFYICMKRMDIVLKKDSYFYIISVVVLGISNFLTDSPPVLFFNTLLIIILMTMFMLHQFYNDTAWKFQEHVCSFVLVSIGTVVRIFYPFMHFGEYLKQKEKKTNSKLKYVFYGLLIAIPLIAIVIGLLSSADIIFHRVFEAIMDNIVVPKHIVGIFFMFLLAFVLAYGFLTSVAVKNIPENVTNKRIHEPLVAITFTSILAAVYLLFCGIQIAYLFIGNLILPTGYTYASYARQGFFQLLFVCVINLVLVLMCLAYFRKNKVLTGILTVISVCTYVMIISSAYRMILYIKAYHLTFLRVFVLWALLVITILMTAIIIAIYKEKFPLFRFFLITVTVLYTCLSLSHPDYIIAKYNLSEMTQLRRQDILYLTHLSTDAAPAFAKAKVDNSKDFAASDSSEIIESDSKKEYIHYLFMEIRDNYFMKIRDEYENKNFRNFDLSRFIAKNLAEKYIAGN